MPSLKGSCVGHTPVSIVCRMNSQKKSDLTRERMVQIQLPRQVNSSLWQGIASPHRSKLQALKPFLLPLGRDSNFRCSQGIKGLSTSASCRSIFFQGLLTCCKMFWISPCVQNSANKGLQGTVKHCEVCRERFTATYDRQLSGKEP